MIFGAIPGVSEVPHFLNLLHDYFSPEGWEDLVSDWENMFYAFLVAVILSCVFYFSSRKMTLVPTGFQNVLEFFVESFQNFVIEVMGPEGKKYVPFLGTIFIYILGMNLIGMIPLMKSPTSSLNITLALAICVFVYVQYANIKNLGVKGFLYHLAGSPKDAIGWMIVPLMLPIEIMTQISRPITLALRLFGNILGEKILVAFFTLSAVTIFYFIPIQTPFMFLGLLTGMMQAMVFTLLSTIYFSLSLEHKDEEHQTH